MNVSGLLIQSTTLIQLVFHIQFNTSFQKRINELQVKYPVDEGILWLTLHNIQLSRFITINFEDSHD